jgi:DNA-binding transcriptional LysR family regulator
MDKLTEMTTFARVVQGGSFSEAARLMNLTPSAVSKLVGRLEDRLGTRLLHRTTRKLALTEEGEAFYQRSLRILAEIDEAEQAVSSVHTVASGTLRVNAGAFATYQVVPLLPEFLDRYPLIRLHLTVTDRIVDLVEEGEDLGIRLGARFESTLVSRLLVEDHRVIVAAPAYVQRHGMPLTPADLPRHNCLTRASPHGGLNDWPFNGPEGPYAVRVRGNVEVNSAETLYELALAGLGIVRLAEFRVGADIAAGRLVPLLVEHHRVEPLPIHAVYPHRKHLSPKVRVFVDFLVEKFTPAPPWQRSVGEQ